MINSRQSYCKPKRSAPGNFIKRASSVNCTSAPIDHEAVLMLECADVDEARSVLDTLPLVREKLIGFELIPLMAYPGFARLFRAKHSA